MINEAVILAGGLGTRLKGVISDMPKPMAPINDIPFIKYLFDYLQDFNIERIILSVGYKFEVIEDYFGNSYKNSELIYAIENEPLGTGGGIANALSYANSDQVFLLNGDTFFKVDLFDLYNFHLKCNSELTLSLKYLQNFDRYGSVKTDNSKVVAFSEKQPLSEGYINGGVYVINKSIFKPHKQKKKFSFEKDIMESGIEKYSMHALICDRYFIDIGIPEDYELAQKELISQI